MNLLKSNVYRKDLNKVANYIISKCELDNKSIFITGCNGLICSAIVDVLLKINELLDNGVLLYLATRNIEKTNNRFAIQNNKRVKLIEYDATKNLDFSNVADFYIHGASNASPELYVSKPVETILANILGIQNILEKAKENNARVLYISSSEIYGNINSSQPIKEDSLGCIELLNSHSSYGISKRAAENLCAAYKNEFNSNVIIARPGHVYGPTALLTDRRVSSQFMYDAVNGKDLVLKSDGKQLRSYFYCLDAASAILFLMCNGRTGDSYNISNPNSIVSIMDMAKYFAKFGGVDLRFELPTNLEKKAFNPMMNSSLDSTKLSELGWKPCFSLQEGFEHSIQILKQSL